MEQKMFIKSKLLAWKDVNSILIFVGWNNSLLNSMPGVSAFI
jgi:hypothetical protein